MFTGIIKETSAINDVKEKNGSLFVSVKKPLDWKIKKGNSISVNGICSTVTSVFGNRFEFEYMEETRKKTTINEWKKGEEINLEPSLQVGDRIDGHFVAGHVDCVGEIAHIQKKQSSIILKIKIPKDFAKYVAAKGSVTLDGISLTVVSESDDWFTVSLVSYTLKNTNLKNRKVGDKVNIEMDILAKYLEKLRNIKS